MPTTTPRKHQPLTPRQQALAESCFDLACKEAQTWAIQYGGEEEAVAEALLHLCRAASAFDPARGLAFSTLATVYVRRGLLSGWWRKTRAIRHPANECPWDWLEGEGEIAFDPATGNADPLTAWAEGQAHREDVAALRRALRGLPDRQRRLIRLRFWEGATLDEIGREAGVCKERVRQLIAAALRQLRRHLTGIGEGN